MDTSVAVVLAVAALAIGPTLVSLLGARRWWRSLLDSYALVAIAGLALVEILPNALAEAGLEAALAAVFGLALPVVFERSSHRLRDATLTLALLGLALHAAVDGAALAMLDVHTLRSHAAHAGHAGHAAHHHHGGAGLAIALVLHRLPVGLLVFSSVFRRGGRRAAWGALATLGVATVAGFFAGQPAVSAMPHEALAVFEAFVAGALLHVVAHADASGAQRQAPARRVAAPAGGELDHHRGHHHGHSHGHHHGHHHGHSHGHHHGHHHGHSHGSPPTSSRWPALIGAVAGVATLALTLEPPNLPALPTHAELDAVRTFVTLARESAPALLVAYLLAGFIGTLPLGKTAAWLSAASPWSQASRGVIFGLPLPICSCGVLPIYASLVRRGAPPAAALAFLVATPELGIDAVLLSVPLLGAPLAIARILAAAVIALVTAVVVSRLLDKAPAPALPTVDAAPPPTATARLRAGLRFGLVELVDHTLPWILLGLGLAALAEPLLDAAALARVPTWLQVPLAALVGVPMYVCASGATPLAAVAIHKGVSAGAALAFLLTGPATNVTTFGVLRDLHGSRLAWRYGLVMGALAVCAGWLVDLAFDAAAFDLHGLAEDHTHLGHTIAFAALGLLLLGSLWRQGARGMVQQILDPVHAH